MKINGIDIDLDLLDLPTLRRVQGAIQAVGPAAQAFADTLKAGETTLVDAVTGQCRLVYACFDTALGPRGGEKVFGVPAESANFADCLRVYKEFAQGLDQEVARQQVAAANKTFGPGQSEPAASKAPSGAVTVSPEDVARLRALLASYDA